MEPFLNCAWVLLTAVMAILWVRFGLREGTSRRAQLVALALLALVLFPVISVSDDLQALQNPAEADCCVRRDLVVATAHSILPAVVALFQPIATQMPTGVLRHAAAGDIPRTPEDHPALAAIENRPPPAA
jgi:hypothetical protein